MAATSLYHNLAKLGRVQLPSGTEYALIDYNGRELITQIFNTAASYQTGDYVIYADELYRFSADKAAGTWDSTKVTGPITVGDELKRLENAISGGVHYVGKTITQLYEGSTTATISIGGSPYTAVAGDMVIFDRANGSTTYQIDMAYNINTYLTNGLSYGITNANITAARNTS